mgnify:FL=1
MLGFWVIENETKARIYYDDSVSPSSWTLTLQALTSFECLISNQPANVYTVTESFNMSQQQLQNAMDKYIARSSNSPTNISTSAKVVSVHDGDTCDLVISRNGGLQKFKCRLAAIDTPELKTGRKAEKARDFLAWLSTGGDPASFSSSSQPWFEGELQNMLDANKMLVHAEFQSTDIYGRALVVLKKTSQNKHSFNDLLMQYGYAKPYKK